MNYIISLRVPSDVLAKDVLDYAASTIHAHTNAKPEKALYDVTYTSTALKADGFLVEAVYMHVFVDTKKPLSSSKIANLELSLATGRDYVYTVNIRPVTNPNNA